MSTLLYALGNWATRAKALVLMIWIAALVLLGAGAAVFGQGANAPITIPGTESQDAIDSLARTFPEVSGTSATIIVVAPDGEQVDTPQYREAIADAAAALETVSHVTAVQTPFSEHASGGLSDDGTAALITIQIEGAVSSVPETTLTGVEQATDHLREALPSDAQLAYGGEAFSVSVPGVSPSEALGVLIAFIVLIFTLGSLFAAGMPLLIALLGVGVSISALLATTVFVELTSTTPMLALMLGLAVGIDYTLFIVSRHQEQLRAGVPIRESIARANATSGSAVVFAGLTVVIALSGLAVARIPFLTSMGIAAAGAVALAVLIAITLTPALLAIAGMRILPKKQRRALAALNQSDAANTAANTAANSAEQGSLAEQDSRAPKQPSFAERFFGRWVKTVTKRPIVTILAVLVLLGVAATPAMQLRLALPDASSMAPSDPARVTYELTGEHFGQGYNGPLLLTGSIIGSKDPLGLMEDLAAEVKQVPGVAAVPLATPNRGADTAIIQVIPEEGPHSDSTAQLVQALRDKHDSWEKTYGVSLAVTGFTAVGIDVSALLMDALLPFGILVVGLSLILLAMVFRSVWVPIKATLGYLLSVGVAFGAVVAVFQWGWLSELLNVTSTGPVISFMPIILMGVLFGLAMDYEVFLVSRIREEYVHGAAPQNAIQHGFIGSARVVTAAALIMFAVFAAFVPEGDASIKVIALGLAVGVFVDAFIVRMTLVPAVLALLGKQAWWMPRWLSKALPAFDVEGEGLARELAHADWPHDMPDARIAADGLVLTLPRKRHFAQLMSADTTADSGSPTPAPRTDTRLPELAPLRVAPGEVLLLHPSEEFAIPLAAALIGRGRMTAGTVTVDGLLLPERAASVRARSAWATAATLEETLREQPSVLVLDLRTAEESPLSITAAAELQHHIAAALEAETTLILCAGDVLAERVLSRDTVCVRPRALRDPEHSSAAAPAQRAAVEPHTTAATHAAARPSAASQTPDANKGIVR